MTPIKGRSALLFVLAATLLSFCAAGKEGQQVLNLRAFAKLYGYVLEIIRAAGGNN